jgi:hypothetical protein
LQTNKAIAFATSDFSLSADETSSASLPVARGHVQSGFLTEIPVDNPHFSGCGEDTVKFHSVSQLNVFTSLSHGEIGERREGYYLTFTPC